MSERRELVAREVFALDADWRREYWDQFRRDFARQAQAYYDTADRILAIVREDAMEVTQHTHADVRERVVDEIIVTVRTLCPGAAGSVATAAYAAADRILALLWEDLVFGPITAAYNEAHDAGREDGRRDAAAEISRLTRELEAARAENRRLREALERVADGGCERFYGTDCWQMGMDPHAEDYAGRVCDPCFARRALAKDTEVSDGA